MCRAFSIVPKSLRGEVRVPVDLDGELARGCVEIDDVGVHAVLAPELCANLFATQVPPQFPFGFRGVVA
jgi:hypothetical protein